MKKYYLESRSRVSKRKANQIGHILRINFILRQIIKGKIKGGIEATGRRGRRRRNLLDEEDIHIRNRKLFTADFSF
jgi:hypothetical protein